MKSINKIVILTLAAAAIVMFWLVPGINKATAVQYTRIYEDTDYKTRVAKDTSKHKEKTGKQTADPSKKVYKSESIRPKDKKVRLNAKMFSRAIQFVEEVPVDTAEAVVTADTTMSAPPF
jgi:flagellar biosynthesis component FlhA